jgi:tetratricopeptide (TPR) repeat protein
MRRYVSVLIILIACFLSRDVKAQYKYYERGHDSYAAGNYSQAIENFSLYLTKATRDKDLDIEAYYLRALAYYKKNEYAKAIADFEETILLNHNNIGNIYWFKAKCNEKTGIYRNAINDYTKAIKELGSDKQVKAKLLYERSQVYMKLGEILLAYQDLETGHETHPANADIKREMEILSKQSLVASRSSNKEIQKNTPPATKKSDVIAKKEEPAVKQTAVKKQPETSSSASKEPKNKEPETKPTIREQQVSQPIPVVEEKQPTLADEYKDEKRFALVIGNSKYPREIGELRNPVNDATDIAKELTNSKFEVDLLTNATYGQMRAAMLKFKEKVDASDRDKTVSLFYYAGHGLQHADENYLVPVDAAIEYEDDIARYCFAVQRMILANMERSNSRMNIVILDACRNNPFPALTRSAGQQGLGEMKRARGSFIAYATAPGSVASDGSGHNGLYTQELLKAMRKPGLTIEQVFKEVRQGVLRMSGDKQNTWDSSNIVGEFFFKF